MDTYRIERVVSRMGRMIVGTAGSVGVFLVATHVVYSVVGMIAQRAMIASLGPAAPATPGEAFTRLLSPWYWGALLLAGLVAAFGIAGGLHGMIAFARGRAVSLRNCASVGAARLLPAFLLTVLWFLGVWVASIFFLAPGLILMSMWAVALPVLVVDRLGIGESFGRSRALTKGSRLLVFATIVATLFVIYAVMFGIVGSLFGLSLGGLVQAQSHASLLTTLVMLPVGWLFSLVICAMLASIYVELAGISSGAVDAELSEVFA